MMGVHSSSSRSAGSSPPPRYERAQAYRSTASQDIQVSQRPPPSIAFIPSIELQGGMAPWQGPRINKHPIPMPLTVHHSSGVPNPSMGPPIMSSAISATAMQNSTAHKHSLYHIDQSLTNQRKTISVVIVSPSE
eukprot:765518-Hanusia_phi.AAC.12